MPSFDDLARAYQQAQEEVHAVDSRSARQRLAAAQRALSASQEAAAQRAATDRQAAKNPSGRSRSWW